MIRHIISKEVTYYVFPVRARGAPRSQPPQPDRRREEAGETPPPPPEGLQVLGPQRPGERLPAQTGPLGVPHRRQAPPRLVQRVQGREYLVDVQLQHLGRVTCFNLNQGFPKYGCEIFKIKEKRH